MMVGRGIALRQLFLLVAYLGICCAALKFTGIWASILVVMALLTLAAMMIVAFVDRGPRQAFAIGFTLVAIMYAGAVIGVCAAFKNSELDPYVGDLPTTKLLRPVFGLVVDVTYVDMLTGKEIPNYDPAIDGAGGGVGGNVGFKEFPFRRGFMAVGHVIWTLLFGCVGGVFARMTYARRQRDCPAPSDRGT